MKNIDFMWNREFKMKSFHDCVNEYEPRRFKNLFDWEWEVQSIMDDIIALDG